MQNVIYIHGANASPDNFNYYLLKLPEHNSMLTTYSMDDDPFDIIELIRLKKLREFNREPVTIIGHSFGGILAAWYASVYPNNVKNLITVATPWHGTPVARIFGYFFRNAKIFKNTRPGADVLSLLQEKTFKGNHINIVCTQGGNPVAGLGSHANDGMVSVDSQCGVPTNFKNSQNAYIEAGHSGVLLNNNATNLIIKTIFGDTNING